LKEDDRRHKKGERTRTFFALKKMKMRITITTVLPYWTTN
jgi:hypothetical protein